MAATSRLQNIPIKSITDIIGDMNLLTKLSGIRYGIRKQTREKDDDLIIEIINRIRTKYHIEAKRKWYLLFDKETHKLENFCETVTEEEVRYYLVKNPDICWYDTHDHKCHVIEIDGVVHGPDKEGANKKTRDRNELYRDAGINLVVLNLAEIKEKGMTPTEFLEELF